ncbi:MAG: arginyltransferase [Xanthomonadales bacterium]|nr:arginyltransferase [Xanthomonadales bacterium]
MRSEVVRLFQTLDHRCGYYPDRLARNLVIDPLAPNLAGVYDHALARGFRRAGGHVYRPHCRGCQACIPCRIRIADFHPSRAQRRVAKRNRDLQARWRKAGFTPTHFALYQRYIAARHAGGGMDNPEPDDYSRFLLSPWSRTHYLELWLDAQLVAVAVTDSGPQGLSAVYTFFEPEMADRSLGTQAILSQIHACRERGLEHLYLGYWITGHPKMAYKAGFRPLETLVDGQWQVRSTE